MGVADQESRSQVGEPPRRSRFVRAIASVVLVIVVAAIAGAGYLYHLTRAGLAPQSGIVRIAGLHAPVKVLRDASGIPHIYAQDRLDLARAWGYVEAQDRAFQTEMRVRLAEGRLAEIFGPSLVELDYVYRLFDAQRFARESIAMYTPEERAQVDAYAAGYDAWVEQHRNDPPFMFRIAGIKPSAVTVADLEASGLPIAVLLSYNLSEEALYLNLAPRFPPETIAELLPVYPGMPLEPPPPAVTAAVGASRVSFNLAPGFAEIGSLGAAASNNWAVDGTKSASGKPMLASDPHLPQSIPSIWHEVVLVIPDGYLAGALVGGLPVIPIGTNGHVAWGVTNVMADVMDLSIERLSPDGASYFYRDKWYPLEKREVTIKVRGAPDVHRTLRSTGHGPLVNDVIAAPDNALTGFAMHEKYALALRFAALTPAPSGRAGIKAFTARNGHELVEAFRDFKLACQNLVWADADGNIGWHVIGAIPNRIGYDGKYPTPGWTGAYEWNGMIPFDNLPHIENPAEHFIVTANNRTADVLYNSSWAAPWRHDRIAQLLQARPKLSPDDFKAIQADRISLYALKLRDAILEAGDGGDTELAWALAELRGFDGAMIESSRAAAIIGAVQVTLAGRVFKDRLGADFKAFVKLQDAGGYDVVEDILMRRESHLWPSSAPGASAGQTIRQALKDALGVLRARLGNDRTKWTWGALHTITFKNPFGEGGRLLAWYFDRGPMNYGGGRHTVNNGFFSLSDPYQTDEVSSYRFIADLADPEHPMAMNHTGESENPASAHYDDMIPSWLAGKYHVLNPDYTEMQAHAASELDLVPAGSR
jgi:penicillin G amidase